MNENDANKLTTFFTRIGGWIVAVISFLTAMVNFFKIAQGDRGDLTIVLLTTGIGALWLCCFYIYFGKISIGQKLGVVVKHYAYSPRARRFALVGIFVVPLLTLCGLFGLRYYKNLPSDQAIILIAEFEGPDPKNYRVTEIIIEELRKITKIYDDVKVKALGEAITAQQGSEIARVKGKSHKANIVLWGWYGKTAEQALVTVHFEVLQEPRFLGLQQEAQTLKLAVSELESFEIQIRLSYEMRYITLLTIGLTRYEAQDYNTAIAFYNDALNQPTIPEQLINPAVIYFARGRAYYAKHNLDSAIVDYNKTLQLKPDFAEAFNNRGAVFYEKGDLDGAMLNFHSAIKFKANFFEAYYNRGTSYAQKRDYEHAIEDFDQAVKLRPQDPASYNNRGLAYSNSGKFDKAIFDFNQAIKLNPKNAEAYNNRGTTYAQKGDLDRSIIDFNQAIRFRYDYAGAYYNRATAYAQKGNLDSAISDFDQAIKFMPDNADFYNNRGIAHASKGDFRKAIIDYDRALQLRPNDIDVYVNRGYAYSQVGPPDSAITNFRRALAISPNNHMILNAFAWHFVEHNENLEEALKLSLQSVKLNPQDAYLWDTLAEIYFRLNRFTDANEANIEALKYAKDPPLLQSITQRSQKLKPNLRNNP